ncbi:ABC transporter substrate-binding protein [Haloarchaeobius sp. DFWS5]|uniref:ABC transporter substrate-binding protein n=1 Tax=Haloarchaeobius sp. DFWS5 TaxID=3446114 RepID=UPI003EB75179
MTRNTDRDDAETGYRRDVLKYTGAVGLAGLAGCVGVGNNPEEDTSDGGGEGGGDGGGEGGGGSDSDDSDDGGSDSPSSVVFGQPASLTGKWDFLQPAVSQSTDLALKEINEAGGVLGAETSVKRRDTAVDPQQARSVVNQLVNSDGAVALIGLFSSEITPLFDFLDETGVPVVTPWPGSTGLDTTGGDKGTDDIGDDEYIWRTVIGDTVHTLGAAQYMLDEGFENIGILNGTSQGERSWADSFQAAFEGNGGAVANRVEVSEGKSSYQSELNKLFDTEFDAWALAVGLQDATTIVREWDSAGYGKQLLMEDGLRDPDLVKAVGDQADGAWIAAGSSQGPQYDSFIDKFQSAGDADVHTWGVAAYDATNVTALAMERAGSTDPAAIQKNLGAVAREGGTTVSTFAEGKEALANGDEINYEGAATPVDFTDFGNVFGSVSVSQVTPDGFEEKATVQADELKGLIDDY